MIKRNDEFLTFEDLINDTNVKVSNSRLIKNKSDGILCLIKTLVKICIKQTHFSENIKYRLIVVNKSRGKSYNKLINLLAGNKENETKK